MNGLIYLLDQAGEALAAANAEIRQLREELAALRATAAGGQEPS